MANQDKAKPDGTISVAKQGSAFMPQKIRNLLAADDIAYIATGKVAILFNTNTSVDDLKKALSLMIAEVEQRRVIDTPDSKNQL